VIEILLSDYFQVVSLIFFKKILHLFPLSQTDPRNPQLSQRSSEPNYACIYGCSMSLRVGMMSA